ncbi:MAG TPA: 6-hydroxymethylpterin diphosphokinase MptE-like protein, partial [Salinarimonas sp.]|nr:6-hydroxymethylpterin diphosphokinase MptE-like protein [Salinarimonas sp.]
FIRHNEPRVDQFKTLLTKASSLMHFDTRSGIILKEVVNPDANCLKNMPAILGCEHKPALKLTDFRGAGKGKAALLVSAGPSLDDEIENLKRLQESKLVLCVGRVYKKLRAAGVRVDYTFSCEMFDWDSAIFDGLTETGDTVLCYPNVCAPATVKAWPGRKVCMLDAQMAELLGETLCMMGGNSVSHHMLNFACEVLDIDEAILVGQDLAYTRPRVTHASGTGADKWPDEVKAQDHGAHAELEWGECYGKGGRFYPECHRQPMAVLPGGAVPAGPMEVLTSKPYKNFATLFEILIARHKKKVRNACGEGLKIAGAPYVNLAEVQ